jgi:hypothetical protein
MEDIDYGALLRHLKEKYGNKVQWVGKKPEVLPPNVIVIQTRVDRETFAAYAKCLNIRRHRYIPLEDIVEVIDAQLNVKPQPTNKHEVNEAGRRLLQLNCAQWHWASNNYLITTIPKSGMLAEWKGWLKFGDAEPRRRQWKSTVREQLFATGMYAWFVHLKGNLCRLYYMGPGKTVTYGTSWFDQRMLHAELNRVTAHADLYKWRQREIAEMRVSRETQEEVIDIDFSRYAAEAAAADAERTRLAAEKAEWVAAKLAEFQEEEVKKANSSDEWCGDISKRYVEDSETGGVIQKGHVIG